MKTIAVDGPSGAGKSSLCRQLAKELGFVYVDTGAMYRAIGLYVLRQGADINSEQEVAQLLPGIHLRLAYEAGEQKLYLNSEDVSEQIRTPEVSMAASNVSRYASVRRFLLQSQRTLAADANLLMDGRDIGSVVLPNADIKLFLTAAPEDRARRRYEQLLQAGQPLSYEDVLAAVRQRDFQDTSRAEAPLKAADDAITVDTTGQTFEESLCLLLNIIKERL